MFIRIALVILLNLIAACSIHHDPVSLAQEGEWEKIGELDGEKGKASRSFSELQEISENTQIDFVAYDQGYRKGIESYCQVDNAYSIGLAGMQYFGVCAHLPDGNRFNMEWQRGYQAFINSL